MLYAVLDQDGRVTTVAVATAPQGSNWRLVTGSAPLLGDQWTGGAFVNRQPQWADPALPANYWWIYVGAFIDRLGADALALAASNSDACKGALALLRDRRYIDLKAAQTATLLNILIATALPAVNGVFPGSGPMTAAKRDAILNTPTTEDERFVKGLAQPT